jgi:hypothetical protein
MVFGGTIVEKYHLIQLKNIHTMRWGIHYTR